MTVKFITVHGTGDETPDNVDPKWWQPESEFCQNLLKEAGGGEIVPFNWDGANDEISRREGAERLLWRLRDYHDRGQEIVLIGHSHGGSVIATALKFAANGERSFDNIKSVITIGTPYIGMKMQNRIWERLNLPGQLAFMYSAFLAISAIVTLASVLVLNFSQPEITAQMAQMTDAEYALEGAGDIQRQVEVAQEDQVANYSTITLSVIFIAITFIFIRRSQKRIKILYSKPAVERFFDTFNTRWLALYDKRDEAINGLMRVYDLKLNLLESSQLQGFMRLLLVFILVLFLGVSVVAGELLNAKELAAQFLTDWKFLANERLDTALLWLYEASPFSYVHETIKEFSNNQAYNILLWYNEQMILNLNQPNLIVNTIADEYGRDSFAVLFTTDAIVVIIKLLLIVMAFPIADILNKLFFGSFFAHTMNNVFGNQVRRQALGNTTKGEDLTGVTRLPNGWPGEAQEFSEEASVALCNFAADNARHTLINIQDVIADASIQSDKSLVEALTEQLSWKELIHTAYFKVPESQKYIISEIVKKSS